MYNFRWMQVKGDDLIAFISDKRTVQLSQTVLVKVYTGCCIWCKDHIPILEKKKPSNKKQRVTDGYRWMVFYIVFFIGCACENL